MLFITINGILLNVAEIQTARTVEASVNEPAGAKVFFIHGGFTVVPDITAEQLQDVLDRAVKSMAPF